MAVNPLSRREVIKSAPSPPSAGVLTRRASRWPRRSSTETKGITARDNPLNVGGTMIPGLRARPERRSLSVVGHLRLHRAERAAHDVVRRLAHAGYYAIAPELFHREGGCGKAQRDAKISARSAASQYPATSGGHGFATQPLGAARATRCHGLLRRRGAPRCTSAPSSRA